MRTILVLLLAFLGLSGTAAAAGKPVILVLGDSLSAGYGIPVEQGWVARLQRRLDAEGYGYAVVNASVTGETTVGALERLPRALARHKPALVVIELGGNDGLRGLPVTELRTNLEALVRTSREAGARVLLAAVRMPPNYGPQYTEKFYAVYEGVARDLRVPWVPFFLEGIALREDLFQDDGIHPDLAAQPILLDNVWPVLEPLLKR
ncbi:MAG: arylesterase [Proteobacteria bacterium]|nr:arylesterase [Pseudomonadota bacterium]